jgi:hypothetical protein
MAISFLGDWKVKQTAQRAAILRVDRVGADYIEETESAPNGFFGGADWRGGEVQ